MRDTTAAVSDLHQDRPTVNHITALPTVLYSNYPQVPDLCNVLNDKVRFDKMEGDARSAEGANPMKKAP